MSLLVTLSMLHASRTIGLLHIDNGSSALGREALHHSCLLFSVIDMQDKSKRMSIRV